MGFGTGGGGENRQAEEQRLSIQVRGLSVGGGATSWGGDHGGAEHQEVGWLKSRDREQRE